MSQRYRTQSLRKLPPKPVMRTRPSYPPWVRTLLWFLAGMGLSAVLFVPWVVKIQQQQRADQIKLIPWSTMTAIAQATLTPASPTRVNQSVPVAVKTATQLLVRINQMDRSQYASDLEYNVWAGATCSTTAMTVVLNAYNQMRGIRSQYRITDVLHTEATLGLITAQQGLLKNEGIAKTLSHYQMKVAWMNGASVGDLVEKANSGVPIIVDFPPGTWSSSGHILVVTGGNATTVRLADSSTDDMQSLSYDQFSQYKGNGFAAAVLPAE